MSNSIGNLKNSGLQGNNFPWQLKMLYGQQCACDQLKLANDILQEIDNNTDQVEPLLLQILSAIQNGSDFEAFLVVDNAGVTWLEVRIWNPATGSFDPPVYFAANSNAPGTPAFPVSYINPNSYLAQIASYTSNLVSIEAGIPNALGQTTIFASMPVALASEQANVQVTPMVIEANGTTGNLTAYSGNQLLSISFASRGTAPVDLSVDGNNTLFRLLPGETLNMDANGVMNYYDPALFYWDASAAGAAVLIAFNYI